MIQGNDNKTELTFFNKHEDFEENGKGRKNKSLTRLERSTRQLRKTLGPKIIRTMPQAIIK